MIFFITLLTGVGFFMWFENKKQHERIRHILHNDDGLDDALKKMMGGDIQK